MRIKEIILEYKIESNGLISSSGFVRNFETDEETEKNFKNRESLLRKEFILFFENKNNKDVLDVYIPENSLFIFINNRDSIIGNKKILNLSIYDKKLNLVYQKLIDYNDFENYKLEIAKKVFSKNSLTVNIAKEEYGGWISPENEIFLIKDFEHSDFLNYIFDIGSYSQAFEKGFVRFLTVNFPKEFALEGYSHGLKRSFKVWVDTALNAKEIIIDFSDINDPSYNYMNLNLSLKTKELDSKILYRILNDPVNYKKYYKDIYEGKKSFKKLIKEYKTKKSLNKCISKLGRN